MSTNFGANQYDDAFIPKRLRNYENPKLFQEMPRSKSGSTKITGNNIGHLMPEYRRSKTDPWGSFIGTWDLPKRLPGNHIDVPTARSPEAYDKLRRDWEETRLRLTGRHWGTYNTTFYKEGTRTYAAPTKTRSKQAGMSSSAGFLDETSSSPAPRKLSPIDRNGSTGPGRDCNKEFDQSYSLNTDKIPLPQLSRPMYAEELQRSRSAISVAAM